VALPVQSYTWPRVQHAVGQWAAYATGLPADQLDPDVDPPAQIAWGIYDRGPMPQPYISLHRLMRESIGFESTTIREAAVEQRITVTETVEGERVGLWLAWSEQSVIVQAGATLEDTRDALLDVLVAGVDRTKEPLEFAADGTDSILVTPKGSWIVDCVALVGCTVEDVEVEDVRVIQGSKRYRIRVQLWGFAGDGDDSIDEYADAMLTSLHDAEEGGGLPFLGQFGVGVDGVPETATDISAVSGALQERRLFFDASFTTASVTYRRDPTTVAATDPPSVVGIF
jgi:hypothetical protein